jgi:hypothetical protein
MKQRLVAIVEGKEGLVQEKLLETSLASSSWLLVAASKQSV